MEKEFVVRYNEETGLWEKYEPYATIDVATEEEFNMIAAAVAHYQRRGRWLPAPDIGDCCYRCSECGKVLDRHREDDDEYCAKCGLKMEEEQS